MHIIAHIFTSIGSVVLFQERKILPILMQIYALFGAQKWTNMRYVHLKAAPKPHQRSLPDNLLLISNISTISNVHALRNEGGSASEFAHCQSVVISYCVNISHL